RPRGARGELGAWRVLGVRDADALSDRSPLSRPLAPRRPRARVARRLSRRGARPRPAPCRRRRARVAPPRDRAALSGVAGLTGPRRPLIDDSDRSFTETTRRAFAPTHGEEGPIMYGGPPH